MVLREDDKKWLVEFLPLYREALELLMELKVTPGLMSLKETRDMFTSIRKSVGHIRGPKQLELRELKSDFLDALKYYSDACKWARDSEKLFARSLWKGVEEETMRLGNKSMDRVIRQVSVLGKRSGRKTSVS